MHSSLSILEPNIVGNYNQNLHYCIGKFIVQIFKNTQHIIDKTFLIWMMYFYNSNRGNLNLKVSDSNQYKIINLAN